jgi:hypothetical protein
MKFGGFLDKINRRMQQWRGLRGEVIIYGGFE